MATHTHNHLLVSTNYTCTTGTWIGETASYTARFCVNGGSPNPGLTRPDLAAGQIDLQTFDCHTDVTSRALTVNTWAGTLAGNWSGDDAPLTEKITANDIDFHIQSAGGFALNALTIMPAQYSLTNIKMYAVDETGHAPLGPNTWTPTAPPAGGSGDHLSPEMALCVSLYSAALRKAGRGRCYVGPLLTSTVGADGRFATAKITMIGTAMRNWQNAVRTRGTPGNSATYAGIVYNRHPPGLTAGPGTTGAVINKIRVGDEPDHQERRTKTRPETFTDFAVT